ncbi:hypothetical protein QEN19_002787 [Hanseniaspora menglaensis]
MKNEGKNLIAAENIKLLITKLKYHRVNDNSCFRLLQNYIVINKTELNFEHGNLNQIMIYINRFLKSNEYKLECYCLLINFKIGLNNLRMVTNICAILEDSNENPIDFLKRHKLLVIYFKQANTELIESIDKLTRKYESLLIQPKLRLKKRTLINVGFENNQRIKKNKRDATKIFTSQRNENDNLKLIHSSQVFKNGIDRSPDFMNPTSWEDKNIVANSLWYYTTPAKYKPPKFNQLENNIKININFSKNLDNICDGKKLDEHFDNQVSTFKYEKKLKSDIKKESNLEIKSEIFKKNQLDINALFLDNASSIIIGSDEKKIMNKISFCNSEQTNNVRNSTELHVTDILKNKNETYSCQKHFEFYDVKMQNELLYSNSNIYRSLQIKKVFDKGYIKYSKMENMFKTLIRLLKMKNSKRKFNEEVLIDNKKFKIAKQLGSGGFGVVYLAVVGLKNKTQYFKAVKCQSFNCDWEFYISRTIISRFTEHINGDERSRVSFWTDCLKNIANPNKAITFEDHSILVMNYIPCFTLLELSNFIKTDIGDLSKSSSKDTITSYYIVQLLKTVEGLHLVEIIHGDLKTDNCMIRCESSRIDKTPSDLGSYSNIGDNGWNERGLYLIDFGKSMDMKLFDKPDRQFVHNLENPDQQDCQEIRNKQPFNYEIDYYGIAAIAHTLLFGEYIETKEVKQKCFNSNKFSNYEITKSLPRGSRDFWTEFFNTFINSKNQCQGEWPMVNIMRSYRQKLEDRLSKTNNVHILIRDIEQAMKVKENNSTK